MTVPGYVPFPMSGGVVLSAGDPAITGTGTITGDPDTFSTDESDASFATLLRGLGQWPNDPFFTLRTESLRMDVGVGDGINSAFRVKARVSAGTAVSPFILVGVGSADLSTFFYVSVTIPADGSYYDDSVQPAWITFADPDGHGTAAAFVATGTAHMFINGYANANHYDLEVAEASIGGPIPDFELPCDVVVDLDLATAVFMGDEDVPAYGEFSDGVIWSGDAALFFPDVWFHFVVDPPFRYEVAVTYDPDSPHDSGGRFVGVYAVRPGHETADHITAVVDVGYNNVPDSVPNLAAIYDATGDVVTFTIGPGIVPADLDPGVTTWDTGDMSVVNGYTRLWIETDVQGAVSAITIRKICTPAVLRNWPRGDDLGASVAPRNYPVPKSSTRTYGQEP